MYNYCTITESCLRAIELLGKMINLRKEEWRPGERTYPESGKMIKTAERNLRQSVQLL